MALITYENKETLVNNPVAEKYKCTADNLNEIKNALNNITTTSVTPNSSYISNVQLNHVVKWGQVVMVNFRGLVSANIPNNATIITLPYQVVNQGTCPAYLGGAYDYASTLWCSYSGNALRAGGAFGSASGKYVHINLVYITSD